jgi:hypothetical protein
VVPSFRNFDLITVSITPNSIKSWIISSISLLISILWFGGTVISAISDVLFGGVFIV